MTHTRCEKSVIPGYVTTHLSFAEVVEAVFYRAYGRMPSLAETQRCSYWYDKDDRSGTLRFRDEKET